MSKQDLLGLNICPYFCSQKDMETSQAYNNANSIYMSAPSSPSTHQNMVKFYSARTSPQRMCPAIEDESANNFDDFEFETSKRFRQEGNSQLEKRPPTSEVFVPMAFADELFSNGQVVPLKPPPRLSYCLSVNGTSDGRSLSAASSPKPAPKIPFARWKSTWSDEFDPFAVALEKVAEEEEREKGHHHRRSRSLSPFRTTSLPSDASLDQAKHQMGPNFPQENGSQESESQMVVRSKGPPNKHKGYLPFGKKVRPVKLGHEGSMKEVEEGETTESIGGEHRGQKGKGFLGRENSEVKVMKEQVAALWKKLRSFSEPPIKRRSGRN